MIDDLNGKLVKPRDVEDLIEKIELMLNLSDKNLKKWGRKY